MSTFTDDELAALRAVAQAATPGKRIAEPYRLDQSKPKPLGYRIFFESGRELIRQGSSLAMGRFDFDEARHIAAFDPPTALRLLDELAADRAWIAHLKEKLEKLIRAADPHTNMSDIVVYDALAEARAALEKLGKA